MMSFYLRFISSPRISVRLLSSSVGGLVGISVIRGRLISVDGGVGRVIVGGRSLVGLTEPVFD